jgi:uncharacterized membrane-anchored protein
MRHAKWLGAVVAAQALFLIGWAGWHEYVRATAPTLLLNTRPVDPRDILRGDYMILNYDISRHPAPADWPTNDGGTAYVIFRIQDDHAVVAEIRRDAPPADETRLWAQATTAEETWQRAPGEVRQLRLNYGIEQFFVPEGKGTPSFKKLEVEVSVSPTHQLHIRRVLLDGQAYP